MGEPNKRDDDDLLLRLEGGDEQALTELFTRHRERLRRMIRLRLDRRLQGRIDSSDVLQDAYLEVARRAREYVAQPAMPPFLWLRLLTGQTLPGTAPASPEGPHAGCRPGGVATRIARRPRRTRLPWPRCSWAGSRRPPAPPAAPRCN